MGWGSSLFLRKKEERVCVQLFPCLLGQPDAGPVGRQDARNWLTTIGTVDYKRFSFNGKLRLL